MHLVGKILGCTFVLLVVARVHSESDSIKIETKLGLVEGSTKAFTTLHGKPIFAFRGIRYAVPPVGELRFEAPIPIPAWNDIVFNAKDEGPACPEPVPATHYPVSEDCLRLNIYTTKLPSAKTIAKPVMVFFHPGGFYAFSGQSVYFGPQYLLDHDVVLVTVNYRLGSLGFLSFGDDVLPGNNGMKDQVIALRFIKDNIAAYGGDPNNVVIMGYSAGSTSVALHMISPMSKGLFHKAIAMSASPTSVYKYPTDQKEIAIKQAKLLKCPSGSSTEIVECLRKVPAQDIASGFWSFQEVGIDPILIWSPVIERNSSKGESFLVSDPTIEFKNGNYQKVPFMTGVTALEFIELAYFVVKNNTLAEIWNKEFDRVAPIGFTYERDTPRSKEISSKVRKFYLGDKKIHYETVDKFGEAYSDSLIGFSVNRLLNLISETNSFDSYYYRFSYKGNHSFFYLPNTTQTIGPVHHDDLTYLFTMPEKFTAIKLDDPASKIVTYSTTMWTNFAKSGNPNVPVSIKGKKNDLWVPYTKKDKHYLDINNELTVGSNLFADRYALWDELAPIPT